jgi:hypothetical protein
LQGRLSAPPEQWQRVSSTRHRGWQRMGSCATTDNARKWANLPCFLLPFPSLLAVRTTVTCKGEKKHNTKLSILSFFQIYSLLSSLSGFLFFPLSGGRSVGFFSPPPLRRRWPFFRSLSSLFSPSLDSFDF